MVVKARDDITLANIADVSNVRRYYLLQSSTLAAPAAPSVNPAPAPWVTSEPSYDGTTTNTLYTVDLTVFSDGTFDYSTVSKSSSYEAAKAAWNKADTAQSAANTALNTAKGKNKIIRSTSAASGTSGYVAGDQWWQYSGTQIIAMWIYSGSAWIAQTLTDSVITNLNAGTITAGTLSADRIAANTITVDKLLVGDLSNIALDPVLDAALGVNWVASAMTIASVTGPVSSLRAASNSAAGASSLTSYWYFTVDAGASYYVGAEVYNTAGTLTLGLQFYDYSKTAVGSRVNAFAGYSTSGTWKVNGGTVTAPSTAAYAKISFSSYSTTAANQAYVTGFICRRAASAELIVDGAITADKLAANSVTAAKMVAGTITANELASNSVTTAKIATNAVTANEIASGSITATNGIVASLDAGKITAGTLSASRIASGSITAAKMVAGTITAASGIIADAAITDAKIANGTISNAKIANLDAGKITTGTISAARISANSITADKLNANVFNAQTITGSVLTAGGGSLPQVLVGPKSGSPGVGDAYGVYLFTPSNAQGSAALEVTPAGPALSFSNSAGAETFFVDGNGNIRINNLTDGGTVDLTKLSTQKWVYNKTNTTWVMNFPGGNAWTDWSWLTPTLFSVSSPTGRLRVEHGIWFDGQEAGVTGFVQYQVGIYTSDPTSSANVRSNLLNSRAVAPAYSTVSGESVSPTWAGATEIIPVVPNQTYWVRCIYKRKSVTSTRTANIQNYWVNVEPA